MTQEKLAREIGVARNTITSYETNNSEPDFETAFKIANFFEVSLDYLFCREKESESIEKSIFSERLKELRKEHKLGQVALSNEVNLSHSLISLYENGLREPTLGALRSLADFFNVSIDYLSGKSDDMVAYAPPPMQSTKAKYPEFEKLLDKMNDEELSAALNVMEGLVKYGSKSQGKRKAK